MTAGVGRFIVARHWRRWSVQDLSWNPPRVVAGPFGSEVEAEVAAERLNAGPRVSGTVQGELFGGGS